MISGLPVQVLLEWSGQQFKRTRWSTALSHYKNTYVQPRGGFSLFKSYLDINHKNSTQLRWFILFLSQFLFNFISMFTGRIPHYAVHNLVTVCFGPEHQFQKPDVSLSFNLVDTVIYCRCTLYLLCWLL